MAKTYLDIQNSAYKVGNIMDWTNALTRLSGVPVDITEVYDSYDKAVEYAATNPVAYEGQLITVTEAGDTTVYVITPAVQGTHVVGEGEEAVTYNVNIKKVGTVPSGDNASITVTEAGLVSLFGFAGAQNGTLPVRENGKLVWKTIEAVAEGDGNDNTTYEFALTDSKTGIIVTPYFNGQPIMEGEEGAQTQKKFELVLDVYTKAEADEKFLAKADYTPYDDSDLQTRIKAIEDDYLKTEDKYDDSDLQDRVKALEDEERYDDTALVGRVEAVEGKVNTLEGVVGNAESGLVKDLADEITRATEREDELEDMIEAIDFVDPDELAEAIKDFATVAYVDTEIEEGLELKADKADFDDLKATVDAFLTGDGTEAALDSLKELIAYIESHDDTDIAGILEDIQAIEVKLAGIDSTVAAYVTAAIDALKIGDYAKASELTALAGRVEALEAKPFDTYATKTEVEAVDGKFADYTTTSDLTGLLADKADVDSVVSNETFEQFKSDNDEAITAARSGAVADVAAVGYALADDVAGTYATKTELSEHAAAMEATVEATLKDYATVESVNTELAKKIDSATVTLANETTSQGATVTGTTLNIVVDAYSRAATAKLIADSIKDIAGEDSIPAVKADLEAEITRSTNKDTAHDNAITALQTAVAEAKTQADKGVEDAKKVSDDLAALVSGDIKTHSDDIDAVKGRLTTLETAKGNHESRIGTAEGKITALEAADATFTSDIAALNTTVSDHTTTIGQHTTKLTELAAADTALDTAIKANTAKFDSYSTTTEMEAAIDAKIAAIPAADLSKHATIEYVNTELAKKADASAVYTKEEADAEFLNQDEVDARINALIVAADPEGGKTISDIQNLVKYVDENAGEIAALVTASEANTNKLAGIDGTVTGYVADEIAKLIQPKASTEITVADDGTLGIGQVSTDKLVQGADTLVLLGGSAKA